MDSIQVADFGLARFSLEDNNEVKEEEGAAFPLLWSPPEAFIDYKFSTKSDVWSFGMVSFK